MLAALTARHGPFTSCPASGQQLRKLLPVDHRELWRSHTPKAQPDMEPLPMPPLSPPQKLQAALLWDLLRSFPHLCGSPGSPQRSLSGGIRFSTPSWCMCGTASFHTGPKLGAAPPPQGDHSTNRATSDGFSYFLCSFSHQLAYQCHSSC